MQDGLSYFYAEVKRLQALLAAAKAEDPLPVLFLIDEIFRGTNSRERLIGSRSYIRELAKGPSVGFIATHDLELIKLADEIEGVTNLHFREDVYDGRMVFDYRLRPGPCPTTNALTIMRLEGLPVETYNPENLVNPVQVRHDLQIFRINRIGVINEETDADRSFYPDSFLH